MNNHFAISYQPVLRSQWRFANLVLRGYITVSAVALIYAAIPVTAASIPAEPLGGRIAQSQDVVTILQQGEALYKAAQYEAALAKFDQVLQQSPKLAAAWRDRAKTLAQLSNYTDAMTAISKAIGYAPHDPDNWVTRGELYQAQGDYTSAIEAYDVALRFTAPEHQQTRVEVSLARSFSLFALGYQAEVAGRKDVRDQQYNAAVQAYDDTLAMAMGEPNEQLSQIWLQRGEVLRRLQRYDEALQSVAKTVQLNPNLAEGWFRQGRVLEAQAEQLSSNHYKMEAEQKWKAALGSYSKATDLDPEYAEAWNSRGLALYNLGRYREAIGAFISAINGKSRNVWQVAEENLDTAKPWYGVADSLFLLGCYKQAAPMFQQALKLNPNDTRIQARSQELKSYLNKRPSDACRILILPSTL